MDEGVALEDDPIDLVIKAESRFEVVLEVMVVAVDAIIKGSPFNRNCNIDTKNP